MDIGWDPFSMTRLARRAMKCEKRDASGLQERVALSEGMLRLMLARRKFLEWALCVSVFTYPTIAIAPVGPRGARTVAYAQVGDKGLARAWRASLGRMHVPSPARTR